MGDLVDRQAILKNIEKIRQGVQMMDDTRRASIIMNGMDLCEKAVMNHPSAESEEFEWCHDCKEYDQEAHCCHRYTKAIRQAVDELKVERTGKWAYKTTDAYIQRTCGACGWSERMYHCNRNQDGLIRNYCPNCGAKMEVEEDG